MLNGFCIARIKFCEKNSNLNEVDQNMQMKFSFINENMEQVHTPVMCRDFLHDIVRSNLNNEDIYIYGLRYDAKTGRKINMDRLVMLIEAHPRSVTNHNFLKNFITSFETDMGIVDLSREYNTQAYKVANLSMKYNSDFTIVSSTKVWMSSPALLSLYTLLIKISQRLLEWKIVTEEDTIHGRPLSHKENMDMIRDLLIEDHKRQQTIKNYSRPSEILYMRNIFSKLGVFISKHRELIDTDESGFDKLYYDTSMNINYFHECGILGFIGGKTKQEKNKKIHELINTTEDDKLDGWDVIKANKLLPIKKDDANNSQVLSILTSNIITDSVMVGLISKEKKDDGKEIRSIITKLDNFEKGLLLEINNLCQSNKKTIHDLIDKTRLVISIDKVQIVHNFRKKLLLAKDMINVIEKEVGIKEKMVMGFSDIKFREYGGSSSYLFTGSKEWVSSPILLTFFTNVLKTVSIAYIDPDKFKEFRKTISDKGATVSDVEKILSYISESNNMFGNNPIRNGTVSVVKAIHFVLDFFKELSDVNIDEEYMELMKVNRGVDILSSMIEMKKKSIGHKEAGKNEQVIKSTKGKGK